MRRYIFLKDSCGALYHCCLEAEKYRDLDGSIALFKARQALEKILEMMVDRKAVSNDNRSFNYIEQLLKTGKVDEEIYEKMHSLRLITNKAAHGVRVSRHETERGLELLFDIVKWCFYKKKGKKRLNGMVQLSR